MDGGLTYVTRYAAKQEGRLGILVVNRSAIEWCRVILLRECTL